MGRDREDACPTNGRQDADLSQARRLASQLGIWRDSKRLSICNLDRARRRRQRQARCLPLLQLPIRKNL